MKKYIFLIAVIFLFAQSCKKDTDIIAPVNIVSKLLAGDSAKTWIDFYRTGIKGDSSEYVIKASCFTDDNWVFKTSGYFEWNEGASKCKDSDPYIFTTGSWTLSADNKYIECNNIQLNADLKSKFKFEIIEITSDKLSLKIASKDLYVSTTAIEEDHVLIAK